MDITSLTGITSDYIEKVAEQNRLVNTSDQDTTLSDWYP